MNYIEYKINQKDNIFEFMSLIQDLYYNYKPENIYKYIKKINYTFSDELKKHKFQYNMMFKASDNDQEVVKNTYSALSSSVLDFEKKLTYIVPDFLNKEESDILLDAAKTDNITKLYSMLEFKIKDYLDKVKKKHYKYYNLPEYVLMPPLYKDEQELADKLNKTYNFLTEKKISGAIVKTKYSNNGDYLEILIDSKELSKEDVSIDYKLSENDKNIFTLTLIWDKQSKSKIKIFDFFDIEFNGLQHNITLSRPDEVIKEIKYNHLYCNNKLHIMFEINNNELLTNSVKFAVDDKRLLYWDYFYVAGKTKTININKINIKLLSTNQIFVEKLTHIKKYNNLDCGLIQFSDRIYDEISDTLIPYYPFYVLDSGIEGDYGDTVDHYEEMEDKNDGCYDLDDRYDAPHVTLSKATINKKQFTFNYRFLEVLDMNENELKTTVSFKKPKCDLKEYRVGFYLSTKKTEGSNIIDVFQIGENFISIDTSNGNVIVNKGASVTTANTLFFVENIHDLFFEIVYNVETDSISGFYVNNEKIDIPLPNKFDLKFTGEKYTIAYLTACRNPYFDGLKYTMINREENERFPVYLKRSNISNILKIDYNNDGVVVFGDIPLSYMKMALKYYFNNEDKKDIIYRDYIAYSK